MEGLTAGTKAYSSVQWGPRPTDHIELNSDLLYGTSHLSSCRCPTLPYPIVNHSCEPNVAFDVSSPNKADWHLKALRDIPIGDTLAFFYPSTEWHMEQAFACQCKAKVSSPRILARLLDPNAFDAIDLLGFDQRR